MENWYTVFFSIELVLFFVFFNKGLYIFDVWLSPSQDTVLLKQKCPKHSHSVQIGDTL